MELEYNLIIGVILLEMGLSGCQYYFLEKRSDEKKLIYFVSKFEILIHL